MTVEGMLRNISSRELTEWEAFFHLEKEDHDKEMSKAKRSKKG